MRILAIDPGTRVLGYCVLDGDSRSQEFVAGGDIKVARENKQLGLLSILESILELVRDYSPDILVVESPFYGKNVKTLIRLGEARGAIIIAATLTGLDVSEVSPAEAKLALTGNGNATKEQVAYMIKQLLSPPQELSTDASDAAALGVAFFHRMALEEVE